MGNEFIKMTEELKEEILFDEEGDEPESEVVDEGPAKIYTEQGDPEIRWTLSTMEAGEIGRSA